MDIIDIEQASRRLQPIIHHIPISTSAIFSRMTNNEIFLKYENQQKTGSFKVRGAYNKIAKLIEEGNTPASVIASSAGNHAQGVAYAAQKLDIPSTIVMPRQAPIAKVSATRGYGANVILHGSCYDDTYQKALEIKEETGAVLIHPFDDYDIIAGQGTLGLEILRDLPAADIVMVPAGGGGLLAGVAYCIKQINPRVKVIGVQAKGADAIAKSFKKDKIYTSKNVLTIADGIAVKTPGTKTMEIINQNVDEIVEVADDDIAACILLLLERTKQVVEPAGAAALTAILSGNLKVENQKIACIISGGNIDVSMIYKVVERGLIQRGRQVKIQTVLPDVPGSLQRFSQIVADSGANIVMIQHDRLEEDLHLNEAILHTVCEVDGKEHAEKLVQDLKKAGYLVELN